MKAALCLVAALAALSLVAAWQRDSHWTRVGYAPDDALMRWTVALKQRNVDKLADLVADVSDPHRSTYGKYWSLDKLTQFIAPSQSDIDAVTAYFTEIGAERVELTASRDFLVVDIPIAAAESALKTEIHAFRHRGSNRLLHRTDSRVRFPLHVASKIDLVTGLSDFADYPHERKAIIRQRRADAIKAGFEDGSCVSSAPDFEGRILGGSSDIGVRFTVYCSNGSPTANPTAPCADFPPALSSVTLSVTPVGHPQVNATATLSELECKAGGAGVVCTFPTQYVPAYTRLAISAQTSYADGSESAVGVYPTLFSPSSYSPPQAIFERYGVPDGTRGSNPNNRQSVTAFEEQYIDVDGDLMAFFDAMGMPRMQPTVIGQNNQSMPGGESTLDIQYVMGVGAGVPTSFWSVTGPGPAVPPGQGAYILEWALQIGNTSDADVPLVTSISYGDTESGYFWKFGDYSYIIRTDVELAKMAMRGLTVIAGSGDAGNSNVGEAGNDISPTDPTCTPFRAFYPSNSKYVTSASSTFASINSLPVCNSGMLSPSEKVVCEHVGEIAVGVSQGLFWTTGGGFSNLSDMNPVASWQAAEVAGYLQQMGSNLPPAEYWNSNGRAYPDVSTLGHSELMVFGGEITEVDGTSASGPVLAGLISLLNDARLNAGLPSMGFLNPFLYSARRNNSAAFHDVTVGTNKDGDIQARCSAFPTSCEYGFKAAPGWDPVNGLGTPNFPILLQMALNF